MTILSLNVTDLMDGELIQLLELGLQEIAENIADESFAATEPRKLTIELTFKPNRDRNIVAVSADSKIKLPPRKGSGTTLILGTVNGKLSVREHMAQQTKLL